jgi:hypothetical protein
MKLKDFKKIEHKNMHKASHEELENDVGEYTHNNKGKLQNKLMRDKMRIKRMLHEAKFDTKF